jgi:hypothetical protein
MYDNWDLFFYSLGAALGVGLGYLLASLVLG